MFTNLLLASSFIFISFSILVNFSRIVDLMDGLWKWLNRFKLLLSTIARAYRRYQKHINKTHFQLSS